MTDLSCDKTSCPARQNVGTSGRRTDAHLHGDMGELRRLSDSGRYGDAGGSYLDEEDGPTSPVSRRKCVVRLDGCRYTIGTAFVFYTV